MGSRNGEWADYPCSMTEWFICNPSPDICYGGFKGNPAYGMYIYILYNI